MQHKRTGDDLELVPHLGRKDLSQIATFFDLVVIGAVQTYHRAVHFAGNSKGTRGVYHGQPQRNAQGHTAFQVLFQHAGSQLAHPLHQICVTALKIGQHIGFFKTKMLAKLLGQRRNI
ncbi:hypothetical protein SDC9_167996 [bioreactor metagenome]|uniref:Uncharacterized protein n=1 Tax=bioreactor metagenome TaxID=1076179 RepID=A0A645G196_9ZZZZ